MTAAAVAPRIHQALADYLKRDVATIDPQQSLRDDLGLDSMATIELLFRIEEAFDMQIPDEDLQKLGTVADVTGYIEGRLAGLASPVPRLQKPPVKASAPAARRSPAGKPASGKRAARKPAARKSPVKKTAARKKG
jgi:acyl carrier protein